MTFVDHAELVWRKLNGGGVTQQAIAEELGWSRGAIGNYA
jgi:predicted transcriptional regulator